MALNARQHAKKLDLVSSNFKKDGIWAHTTAAQLQILAWTGRSEPPLPRSMADRIKAHFRERNLLDRIGFDVRVVDNPLYGMILESGLCAYGAATTAIDLFS